MRRNQILWVRLTHADKAWVSQRQHSTAPVRNLAGVILVAFMFGVAGCEVGVSTGPGDQSSEMAEDIRSEESEAKLQAILRQTVVADASVTVDDANCTQVDDEQAYSCDASYTARSPSKGLSETFGVPIAGTCESHGDCEWHPTGPAVPIEKAE